MTLRNAIAALSLTLAALANATARADHLKLGNEGIYPPFSIVDSNGNLTGIEPNWAREMKVEQGPPRHTGQRDRNCDRKTQHPR